MIDPPNEPDGHTISNIERSIKRLQEVCEEEERVNEKIRKGEEKRHLERIRERLQSEKLMSKYNILQGSIAESDVWWAQLATTFLAKLPPELRDMVYDYLHSSLDPFVAHEFEDFSRKSSLPYWTRGDWPSGTWIPSSAHIPKEIAEHWYKNVLFELHDVELVQFYLKNNILICDQANHDYELVPADYVRGLTLHLTLQSYGEHYEERLEYVRSKILEQLECLKEIKHKRGFQLTLMITPYIFGPWELQSMLDQCLCGLKLDDFVLDIYYVFNNTICGAADWELYE